MSSVSGVLSTVETGRPPATTLVEGYLHPWDEKTETIRRVSQEGVVSVPVSFVGEKVRYRSLKTETDHVSEFLLS